MRPVRGADFNIVDIKLAELVSVCDFDSVLRDVPICRMIFERIQRPNGGIGEATRDDLATPNPNTCGRHLVRISVMRVDADFIRMQTHIQQMLVEDRNKLIAYEDLLGLVSPFSELESEYKHLLVIRCRQLRHRIDERALYGR